ncbi:putative peptidyl-tRNA hydrolase, PTH2, peptidyl-tRNA hydrolase II domain superfamily [Helianthus annuus]|nr:putative peptidyl-tRNA hydrolase, PTH2, peptidyl-tRNA hydrolase II domain superfamily [Helianthus annuus]
MELLTYIYIWVGMVQVTLEVKGEVQLKNLSEKLTSNNIAHKLWIEQPENYPTCLASRPYPKSVVSPFFKKLKLCK